MILKSVQTEADILTLSRSTKSGKHLKISVCNSHYLCFLFRFFQRFYDEFKNQHSRMFDKLPLESQKFFWLRVS